jgi:hypothetical protein
MTLSFAQGRVKVAEKTSLPPAVQKASEGVKESTAVILSEAKDLRSCFLVQRHTNNCRDASLRSA